MNDEISSRGDEGPGAFYGRKDELQTLLSAWERARKGSPQWVLILAETGVGKTRLVQEFYRCISSRDYLESKGLSAGQDTDFDPNGYWPDDLPIERDKLGLNPDLASFPSFEADKAATPPWLWWGIRGNQGVTRNGAECLCAARDAIESLELHTASMMRLDDAKELAVDAGKKLLNAVSGGWVDVVISLAEIVGKSVRVLNQLPPDAQIPAALAERKKAELKDLLTKAIVHFLDRNIPVVLVLDDAHWLDPDTLGFIDRLIGKLPDRDTSSKLLIISTSWRKEWNEDAAFRRSYKNFSGEKPPAIELGVIDDDSARAYLKKHLPGVEESDIRFILDRAQGNFRYLSELQLLLNEDTGHFVDEDMRNPLSDWGRERLSEVLDIEKCIRERFSRFPPDVRAVLQRSSHQGQRFDPSLTAQVVGDLEGEQIPNGETTFGAIEHGENPGAMITTVDENLKEFLQGPYWRLIHERLLKTEGKKVKAAYHRILIKAVDDPKMANNKVLASVALQALADGVDQSEAVRLYGWLIKYAWQGREASSTIMHIRALLELAVSFSPKISPDVGLVALRFRNQFGYGIKLLDPSWVKPTSPYDLGVELRFENAFVLPLQMRIFEFQETGALPDGGKLEDLIDWCDALVEYRKSLGHKHHYMQWLGINIELIKKQLKVLPDRIDLNAAYIIDICDLNILLAHQAKSQEDWDFILELFGKANSSVVSINKLDNDIAAVYLAFFSAVFLLIEKRGREYYPEDENPGDEDHQDHNMYFNCMKALGNILVEHDDKPEDSTVSRMVRDRDFNSLEAIIRAGCYIQELAVREGYDLVPEFSDLLLGLCGQIFDLIEKGVYAPPSLAISMLEVQNAAAQVLYRKAGKREVQREFGGVGGLPDELPSSFITNVNTERPVAQDEPKAQLQKALASVERYRELGWLPVGLLKMAAISQIELLHLTELTEKPGTNTVGRMFDQMLADAELSEDADRLAYGEPVELLQWLVMTYDKWLHGSPGCDAMWNKVRETYGIAKPKFDRLVGRIRQHQAALQ